MGLFGGFVGGLLFTLGSAMFVYSAWRVATDREARLLRFGQMAFYAGFMLVVLPKESAGVNSDWPYWAAFAFLLLSFGLTLAHKLGPRHHRSTLPSGHMPTERSVVEPEK